MSTISALGTGSGLDLNSLVEQLLRAERAPVENRLNQRQERVESQLSALGLFSGALSGLRDAARNLQNGNGLGARQAVSGNPDLFSATARENTAPGSFAVRVVNLAEADKLASQAFADSGAAVGTGTLSFASGEQSFSITVDESSNSLADIRDAINRAPDNRSVSASIINDADGARLILTGRNTGAENAISVTASGGNGGLSALTIDPDEAVGLNRIASATDAVVEIDGFTITSASNRIEGAIDGITLDLKAADPENATTLTINENRSAIIGRVQTFVDRFNALADVLEGLAGYNPDTEEAGPLLGNATVRSVAGQVRSILSGQIPGAPAGANSLVAIGVTSNGEGRLQIDQGRLNQAIDDRPQALTELFTGDDGLGARLTGYLGNIVGAGSVLEGQSNNLQSRLQDIARQRESLDARLERVEARFVRQFSALDSLIAELNQTSAFLEQQFSALDNLRVSPRRR